MVAEANRGGILERACFVFANREFRLARRVLFVSAISPACACPARHSAQRIERIHRGERTALATWERKLSDGAAHVAWREHVQDFRIMRSRQRLERDGLSLYAESRGSECTGAGRGLQAQAGASAFRSDTATATMRRGVPCAARGAGKFLSDGPGLSKDFQDAAQAKAPDRADDLVQRMEAFRKRNPKHDFGHRRRR